MTYTRPAPRCSGSASSSDGAPAASDPDAGAAAASSGSSAAAAGAGGAGSARRSGPPESELEDVHELWHYRARPSPKGTAPGPDGEHLWLAERMAQDASDAALASMRGQSTAGGSGSKTRRKKNAVADVPASSPSF